MVVVYSITRHYALLDIFYGRDDDDGGEDDR